MRDEMPPHHQPLPLICRAPQTGGGGDFCGPGRDAGSDRDAFSAPTRILTVILWVGAGMRGLLELLLLVKRRGAQAHTAACGLHAGLISCFLRS